MPLATQLSILLLVTSFPAVSSLQQIAKDVPVTTAIDATGDLQTLSVSERAEGPLDSRSVVLDAAGHVMLEDEKAQVEGIHSHGSQQRLDRCCYAGPSPCPKGARTCSPQPAWYTGKWEPYTTKTGEWQRFVDAPEAVCKAALVTSFYPPLKMEQTVESIGCDPPAWSPYNVSFWTKDIAIGATCRPTCKNGLQPVDSRTNRPFPPLECRPKARHGKRKKIKSRFESRDGLWFRRRLNLEMVWPTGKTEPFRLSKTFEGSFGPVKFPLHASFYWLKCVPPEDVKDPADGPKPPDASDYPDPADGPDIKYGVANPKKKGEKPYVYDAFKARHEADQKRRKEREEKEAKRREEKEDEGEDAKEPDETKDEDDAKDSEEAKPDAIEEEAEIMADAIKEAEDAAKQANNAATAAQSAAKMAADAADKIAKATEK